MSDAPPPRATPHGILPLDKPAGCTSHDVVAWARRALGTRAVGHAGTLDPMATGLLLVLVGEATKLSSHLTGQSKTYAATVRFGAETDTLDADGTVTQQSPPDATPPDASAVRAALAAMVGPLDQIPPAVSAIKVDGEAMHARVRRGEVVTLPPRPVVLHAATVTAVRAEPPEADVEMTVSKGFYVRALARDLAASLGTLGHLTALRRTRSGGLDVADALSGETLRAAARGDTAAREAVRAALRPLAWAATLMEPLTVTDEDAAALRVGKRLARDGDEATLLVLDPAGVPVCVGSRRDGVLSVVRGLLPTG